MTELFQRPNLKANTTVKVHESQESGQRELRKTGTVRSPLAV